MNESTNTPLLETTVLSVGRMQFASEHNKVAAHLEHQPGVARLEASPVAQTAATDITPPAPTAAPSPQTS